MTKACWGMLLAAVALTGCGGDDSDAPDGGGGGRFSSPADFDRTGCTPGGFTGDPKAIYHLTISGGYFRSVEALRIDGPGDAAMFHHDLNDVRISDDDVFVRSTDDGVLRAIDLCARDADGTVRGHAGWCASAESCAQVNFTGQLVTRFDAQPSSGITQLLEYAGPADAPWPVSPLAEVGVNVRVADNIAYLARYRDGLYIIDLTDLANPVQRSHLPVEVTDGSEIYNDIKIADGPDGHRYALLASNVKGVVVVDVTDPALPAVVGHFGIANQGEATVSVHTIFLDGGRAYLASPPIGLEIYDLADPRAPVLLGSYTPAGDGFLHDLYVAGNRGYLCWWSGGLKVVDLTDPADVKLLTTFDGYGETSSHSVWVTTTSTGKKVAIHGDEQYGSHVHIVDVDEASVDFGNGIGEWETRPEVSAHNMMAMGDLAVMSYYQDGIRVLDVSDPTAPRQVAWFASWPGYSENTGLDFYEGAVGIDLDPESGRIYVADAYRGLYVLGLDR